MRTPIGRVLKWVGLRKNVSSSAREAVFVEDQVLGVNRRRYESYEEYLQHQGEKLHKFGQSISQSDREYEALVARRYSDLFDFRGKSILCLGARLGGEVRAFKSLGALAIGIDIEPGPGNLHVLPGDFHDIAFPDQCFDFAFCNAIDHVFDLSRFVSEVARVLKDEAWFLVELGRVKPGGYEVLDTSDLDPIVRAFEGPFVLASSETIRNRTSYIDWEGVLLQFRRTSPAG